MATNVCICTDSLQVDGDGRLCVKHGATLTTDADGLQVAPAYIPQVGSEPFSFTADSAISGAVTFPVAFPSTPRSMWAIVKVGSNRDLLVNIQGLTNAGFSFRIWQASYGAFTDTGHLLWGAYL